MRVSIYKIRDEIFALTDEQGAFDAWRSCSGESVQKIRYVESDRDRVVPFDALFLAAFDAGYSDTGLQYNKVGDLVKSVYSALFDHNSGAADIRGKRMAALVSGREIQIGQEHTYRLPEKGGFHRLGVAENNTAGNEVWVEVGFDSALDVVAAAILRFRHAPPMPAPFFWKEQGAFF